MFGKDFITTAGAKAAAVGAAAVTLSSTLLPGKVYSLVTTTNTWVKQGLGAQTAVGGAANNVLVPAGGTVYLHGSNGDNVSVIQDAAGGNCSLNPITEI